MKKGKTIIGIAFIFLACVLTYITFFSRNPHLNTIIFFFGMMITICGLSFGCEKIEKAKINK